MPTIFKDLWLIVQSFFECLTSLLWTVLFIVIAIIKARSGGMEVAKWEAVGEAEALSESMDPDAWNATIFQLTGAMPALKEIREAAQLGPSADAPEKPMEPTVDAPIPEDAGAPAAAKAASQEAPAEASAAAKTSSTT